MLPIHRKRIEKLKGYGKNVVIVNYDSNEARKDPNFFYYTGMDVDYGALWIPAKGPVRVFVSQMDAMKHPEATRTANIMASLKSVMKGKTAWTNYSSMPMKIAVKFKKLYDASHILSEIRSVKSAQEIETIRENAEATQKILKSIDVFGRTEQEVMREIDAKFSKLGGKPAYDTIVAGGANTNMPHHRSGAGKISRVCYIDAGIKRKGYVSDITRSYLSGAYQKQLELILESIRIVEDAIMPGVPVAELDKICRKALGEYSKNFIHALGHGIGLEVHESPTITSGSKEILKKGMIITIEPGIYTKSYGLRVENDYVVTKNGFRRFSKTLN